MHTESDMCLVEAGRGCNVVTHILYLAVAKPKLDSHIQFLVCPFNGWSRIWRDTMKNFATKINRFLKSEDGPTAVEYAVMLALIVVVCLGAITSIGSSASGTFSSVAGQL